MKQTSIHLRESQVNLVDSAKAATWMDRDLPRIDSRSEIIRKLLDIGIDALDESVTVDFADGEMSGEALCELIDDETMLKYLREERKDGHKDLFRGSKIAKRFSEKADELFEGEPGEKATPQTIRTLAESYKGELEDQREFGKLDDQSVELQKQEIDDTVERYEQEYEDAVYAPTETMRETPEEALIGSQIRRLHNERDEFIEMLRSKAGDDRYNNPEDLIGALAYEYGVQPQAIEMLIDGITPDSTDGRQALKNGSGVEIPKIEDADQDDIDSIEELPEDAEFVSRDADARSAVETDGGEP